MVQEPFEALPHYKKNDDNSYSALCDIMNVRTKSLHIINKLNLPPVGEDEIGTILSSQLFPTIGYSHVSFSFLLNASATAIGSVFWSHDGETIHGIQELVTTGDSTSRVGDMRICAPFMGFQVRNQSTEDRIVDGWAYLSTI